MELIALITAPDDTNLEYLTNRITDLLKEESATAIIADPLAEADL